MTQAHERHIIPSIVARSNAVTPVLAAIITLAPAVTSITAISFFLSQQNKSKQSYRIWIQITQQLDNKRIDLVITFHHSTFPDILLQ